MSFMNYRQLSPLLFILYCYAADVVAFSFQHNQASTTRPIQSLLRAKPTRLEDNDKGVLYVNDRCINCAACSYFAPDTFTRSSSSEHHIVFKQPTDTTSEDFSNARAALAACPVSAIRTLSKGEVQHHGLDPLSDDEIQLSKAYAINPKINGMDLPFPRKLSSNVWMVGHHNEKSFGAAPYIVKGRHNGKDISILVDVPRMSPSAISAVESITNEDGPSYLFLTHVDDSDSHLKWKERYPNMKRIFHSGDLGEHNWIGDETLEDVEVLLQGESSVENGILRAFSLDASTSDPIMSIDCKDESDDDISNQIQSLQQEMNSDFLILHTPGHSPGSISLLHVGENYGTIFTGDTYAYTTRNGGHMSGFPRYGNDLGMQVMTLQCLNKLSSQFDLIACGHGHPRSYLTDKDKDIQEWKSSDIIDAIAELRLYC